MEDLAQKVAEVLGLPQVPNLYDWLAIVVIFFLVFYSVVNLLSTDDEESTAKEIEPKEVEKIIENKEASELPLQEEVVELAEKEVLEPVIESKPKLSWKDRLSKGLSKTREDVWNKVGGILNSSNLTEEQFEEIEEILYTSDLSPSTVGELLDELRTYSKKEGQSTEEFISFIKSFLSNKMSSIQEKVNKDLYKFENKHSEPKVIMIVGVNGAGKTTTIGKLATKLNAQGAKVVVGACDTFRAAAVEQLEVWCKRAGVEIVKANEGVDPSGVAFDTVKKAQEIGADYCIIDTAGRLHTASNLMDELKKTKKVMGKVMPNAPHETLLVIDAITGQNALKQAEEFNKTLELSGLIFTKCDGSSKAGSAVGIVQSLQVPITYIGVGEDVDDLNIFDLNDYLDALLGLQA